MKTIPRSLITILPNRQRAVFEAEALQELADSIEKNSLLHPPVLRKPTAEDRKHYPLLSSLQDPNCYILVAGERRLRAIDHLFYLGFGFISGTKADGSAAIFVPEIGDIPFTDLGDLTELQAEEVELDENLKRRDLTWQEHAAAVQRLHKLRATQKKQNPTTEGSAAVQTYADTAMEILGKSEGFSQDSIRKEILVAGHLHNPLIAKAKSADEAFKILKREEQATANRKLAAEVGASFTSSTHQLINQNCLDYMKQLIATPGSPRFDVILTDPPYGIGAQDFGDGAGRMTGIEHHYDDSYESWQNLMSEWTTLSYQVAAEQSHAYVFCDIEMFAELKSMMKLAGWYVFRTPFINHKLNSGRVPLPDKGPRRQYEVLLYAIKGGKLTTHIYPDVISSPADTSMTHGAQKPVAVYENLLQRSVKAGDKVADFFAGSGTIIPAAHTFKCTAYAVEQSPEYFGMCVKRVKELAILEEPGLF